MDTLQKKRLELCFALKEVLNKKLIRKESYVRKQEELVKRCKNCPGATKGAWYCEDCTTGLKLHYLDAEYSDINDWWKNNK